MDHHGLHVRIPLVALLFLFSGCAPSPTELALILAIVVVLFGASRLPQLGRALGETLRSFRKASTDSNDTALPPDQTTKPSEHQDAEITEKDDKHRPR